MAETPEGTSGEQLTYGRQQTFRDWIEETFLLSASGSQRLLAMEGMRGFSIILVFFVHFCGMTGRWLPDGTFTSHLNSALATMGHQGVDLFFVISGFLMYSALISKPRPYLGFLARRAQRLYPTFLAVFSLYVVLSFAFPRESKIPSGIGPAVTYLTQNALLLPGVFRISPMITAAWSLSFEAAFYLILPPLIAVLGLRSRSPRVRIVVIGALSLIIAIFFYRWYRAAMFGAGIILAEWSRLRAERREGHDWDTFGLVALIIAIPVAAVLFNRQLLPSVIPNFLRFRPLAYVLVLSVAFLPMCIAAFSGKGRLARFFTLRPLRLLGNMSYSYYLLHGVTLKGLFFVLAMVLPHGYPPVMSWVLLPFAFALTCLTSGVLFTLVERPYSIAAPKQVMAY